MTQQQRKLNWEEERREVAEVIRGEWTTWVVSARKPKDIVLREAEERLASRIGLTTIPRGGVCSFGWIVSKMINTNSTISLPGNDPMVMALNSMTVNRTSQNLPGMANLVLNLMVHRRCTSMFSHNCFYSYGHDAVRLFDNTWNILNEEVLTWAMLQSPFIDLHGGQDEWVAEAHTVGGRLHNTDGVAFRTTRGRTLYALNGVTMDKEQFSMRGRALEILRVQNVEVRRVLIEDMGPDRFIRAAGLTPIHTDETGRLYRLEDSGTEAWRTRHLCWVHVTCPSTAHEYMLAVPPTTRTAREGVAWTFRKLPEEYQPGIQT